MIHRGDTLYSIRIAIHVQLSVDEYIWKFKAICHKQAAIGKPLSNVNKVFQVSKGFENKYKEFEILVLFKYSSNLLCLSKF